MTVNWPRTFVLCAVGLFLICVHSIAGAQVNNDSDASQRARDALRSLNSESQLPVFGSQLFQAGQSSNTGIADPTYILQRGDRVAVRAFGAYNADFVEQIDQNGILFIPQVGPVNLAGRRAGDLRSAVESAVRQTFTENVRIYATLLTPGSIGVYVSGDVNLPGRFMGTANDDILFFLKAAGGIHLQRGSFRDISVLRNNELLTRIDLYDFLLRGRMPSVVFQEGDVVFVGERGPLVGATGDVLAGYAFELTREGTAGEQLLNVARPTPGATHVSMTGTRNTEPFVQYLPIDEFATVTLADGDRVEFRSDVFGQTIAVAVESSQNDVQAVYVLPRDTLLSELLAQTPVNDQNSDLASLHVNRQSVAVQQKAALDESLNRLERNAAFGSAFSAEAAQVARAEAEIIQSFVKRARELEPSGTITVMEDGHLSDLTLEDGDVVVIPSKTDVVLVAGEVHAPGAFVVADGLTVRNYIRRAGGFQDMAHRRRFVVLQRSGAALEVGRGYRPQAGDQILVLPRASNRGLLLASEITEVIFQLALSTATVARL